LAVAKADATAHLSTQTRLAFAVQYGASWQRQPHKNRINDYTNLRSVN